MHPRSPERKTVAAQKPPEPTALAIVAVILANVALAFGPWFVRLADVGPVSSAFWRITLAAPLLAGTALATGWRPFGANGANLSRLLWGMIALGGICFAADLGSWHLGILRTTLANATLFGNCAILMFPIYGFLVSRAWPTRIQGIALALATAGAILLMGRSYQLDSRHLAGDMLCLLAGVLYTAYFILMARARTTLAPIPALALSTMASVLPLLIFAQALGEQMWPTHWGPLIGLALVSQVIGQGLMIFALGKLPPLVVGLALLVQPMVAATIGWTVYGEKLGLADLFGASLVAVALVLVSRRARD
ncbi:DMT family transporter [Sphingomonas sp. CARO-RG-8B-R24-01]|uniref:DMT family transporter n=1 Tax=Sphingomonas sp. CARO-RG-8B-R24-01 TaxID=2914831 RepID=UPI001F572555|nr:DMT family transporter [Sphingomonas sp. CARO-RG-8B-R24-01]